MPKRNAREKKGDMSIGSKMSYFGHILTYKNIVEESTILEV